MWEFEGNKKKKKKKKRSGWAADWKWEERECGE